jgi:hypothetical protein
MKQPLYSLGGFGLSPRNSRPSCNPETQDNHSAPIAEFYLLIMNRILRLSMVIFVVSGMSGCSRGYDPTQVTATKNAAGETTYALIAPIKGKPFADGAQYLMDNLVKSQAGGDIQSIKVDPGSVQVTFSQDYIGAQQFGIIGQARLTLVGGKGQFDVFFWDVFTGLMGPGRTMPNCTPVTQSPITAYSRGLAAWMADYNDFSGNGASADTPAVMRILNQQLSLAQLVEEITAEGSIKTQAFDDWRKANTFAWQKYYPLYLAETKKAQAQ